MNQIKIEEFIKKSEKTVKGQKEIIVTKRIIKEDDFVLSVEEIDRMEKNALARIVAANTEIDLANLKLSECEKMRNMLGESIK